MNEPRYANYRERKSLTGVGRIRTGENINSVSNTLGGSKDKKSRIEDSIKRLGSPPRRYQIEEAEIRKRMAQQDDLVYSIKMTQEEYEQYQNARQDYKHPRGSPHSGTKNSAY